jgi:hypothetical protein
MKDHEPDTNDHRAGRSDVEHREDALDEALADSFPASDPPAMVRASRRPLAKPASKFKSRSG